MLIVTGTVVRFDATPSTGHPPYEPKQFRTRGKSTAI